MFIYAGGHVMRDVKAGMLIAQHPIYRTSNADRDLMNYWKSAEDNNNPDINPAFAFQNQAAMKAKRPLECSRQTCTERRLHQIARCDSWLYHSPTFVEKIHDSRYPPECTGTEPLVLGRQ